MEVKVQFIEQKNMLRDQLDDIIDEHEDLLEEYGALNEQLQDKDSLIQSQIAEIKDLIRTQNNLQEAKKKIEILKKITKKYIANIDSLLVVNEQLNNEKDSVITVNKHINWKNFKLKEANKELEKTVSKGSVLHFENIQVEAIIYKSTGKEVYTKKAKKTQKIRVCFTVSENAIAKQEMKTIYLQLIDKNGVVLQNKKDFIINILQEEIKYTASSEFEYKNIELAHCIEWERINVLLAGEYLINLFFEENLIGQTTFSLK